MVVLHGDYEAYGVPERLAQLDFSTSILSKVLGS
jgi:hypothetical protein